jgi:hypothetical protein
MWTEADIEKAERQLARGNVPLCVSALWRAVMEAESQRDVAVLTRAAKVASALLVQAPESEGVQNVCAAANAALLRVERPT